MDNDGAARKQIAKELGRLNVFGVKEHWQAAYLLPRSWRDFSAPTADVRTLAENSDACIVVRPTANPTRSSGIPPRASFLAVDAHGRTIYVTGFGDLSFIEHIVPGKRLPLYGKVTSHEGRLQFRLDEVVPLHWIGKLRPNYPGKPRVINAESVRDRVIPALPDFIPRAVKRIRRALNDYGNEKGLLALSLAPAESLQQLLQIAHLPENKEQGELAQAALERLAALDILHRAHLEAGSAPVAPVALSKGDLQARINAIPFSLTEEQDRAIFEIADDIRRPQTMRRLLSGDVGTGKTAVYGSVAAAACDAGARVAILLPNIALATQVFNELQQYYPDLAMQLVQSKGLKKAEKAAIADCSLVIGTTAILSTAGQRDVVMVDEQQKFSRAQREKLTHQGAHLLEISATCIPRSQALAEFGINKVSKLSKGHVEKTIHTHIRPPADREQLFLDALQTVADGHQVAIVYPSKGDSETPVDEVSVRKSAEHAVQMWERHAPGRVRMIHGGQSDDEKQMAIADMKAHRADVLVATTVIEVGLTVPELRRVIIVDAERHGLTGLHQLRGRLARHGGEGYFDLFLSRQVPEEVLERLSILEKTTDGFEVAEYDLRLRGHGELAGSRQTGGDDGILKGRTVSSERISEMAPLVVPPEKADPTPWADENGAAGMISSFEVNEDAELEHALATPDRMTGLRDFYSM